MIERRQDFANNATFSIAAAVVVVFVNHACLFFLNPIFSVGQSTCKVAI